MIDQEQQKWVIPIFVAVGVFITQLFLYGSKVKRRVRISFTELVGDIMQFGVKCAVIIAAIQGSQNLFHVDMHEMWKVVSITILIATSFDTYLARVKTLATQRIGNAANVLFGSHADAFVEVPKGQHHAEEAMLDIVEYKGVPKTKTGRDSHAQGRNLRKSFRPVDEPDSKMQALIDELDKMNPKK
jgi:hypothetical protein